MNTTKIMESEISALKVASLPTRPTAPSALGGRGYTASDMKAAFDKLPLFIIERLNSLIEDISELGENSLAGAIPTGIVEGQTLNDLFRDIESGEFASYLCVFDKPLNAQITELIEELEQLKKKPTESVTVNGMDRGRVTESTDTKGICHLRGNESEWRQCDLVIPEGELALCYREDGGVTIKLGDGKSRFSELDPIGCRVRFSEEQRLTLAHMTHTRYQTVKALELSLPGSYEEDFYSILSFDSGSTATAIAYPDYIFFSGEDVEDGVFCPLPKKHYTVTFYQGGRMCAHVNAAPLDSSMLGLQLVEGLCSVGVPLASKESLSDVQLLGISEPRGDGFRSLGEYDEERGEYCITLRTHNGNLMSYEEFAERLKKGYGKSADITLREDALGISYTTQSTPYSIFIGADRALPMGNKIRIRFRMLTDAEPTGKPFHSGLIITYNQGDRAEILSATPYTSKEEGVFIDFVTDTELLYIDIMHADGARRTILKEGFSILAEGYGTPELEPQPREYAVWLKEPLRGYNEEGDILSIDDSSVTRWFLELPLSELARGGVALVQEGELPVFSAPLEVAGAPYCESNYCDGLYAAVEVEELIEYASEYSFYIEGNTFYFTLDSSVTTVEEATEYLASASSVLLYRRESSITERIEKINLETHLPFTAFESGTLALPMIVAYYTK